MAGKGDKQRPRASHVSEKKFEDNWDKVFKKEGGADDRSDDKQDSLRGEGQGGDTRGDKDNKSRGFQHSGGW